jgi:drug/metabolite transporter (DMT)-like permease
VTRTTAEIPPPAVRRFIGSERHAIYMLVVVTGLWGLSFPLSKRWLDAATETRCPGGEGLGILTLIAVRTLAAVAILALFQPRLVREPNRREFGIGLFIGSLNFVGFLLQVWGQTATSPALSAFLTSVGSAWVPLMGLAFFRQPVARLTVLGFGIALVGLVVLTQLSAGQSWALGKGEQLTLLCSVVFAFMIVALDRWGRAVRPGHLTVAFLTATALLGLVGAVLWAALGPGMVPWLQWMVKMGGHPTALWDLTLLTIFCTVLSFHWFTAYQPRVSANRAALIYLLEPVFGTIFSVFWGMDKVEPHLVWGGALILGGNLLVELPGWLRSRVREPQ